MTTEQHPGAGNAHNRIPRAAIVWGAFLASASLVVAGLAWIGPVPGGRPGTERLLPEPAVGALVPVNGPASVARPAFAPRDAPLARGRWTAIVVHDSGSPAGDLASLERRHCREGLAGLGFHFVIGNGQGIDDGSVVAGFRWDRQLPGAHAAKGMTLRAAGGLVLDSDALNRGAVSICVVGNASRRPPTEAQIRELLSLVRAVQAEFGIGSESVRFRSELGGPAPGPGHFPLARFRAGLLP